MLTRDQASDIFDRVKKLSTAEEVEVLFSGGRFALTRFANNTIHQNGEDENHIVYVRTVFGGRTARATTNKFDDDGLRRVVESSEALAKVQHPDPDLLPTPDSREAAGPAGESPASTPAMPARHFAQTPSISPPLLAEGVKKTVEVSHKPRLPTGGIRSRSRSV